MLFEILFILSQKILELLARFIFWLLKELFALCKKYFWQHRFEKEINTLEIKNTVESNIAAPVVVSGVKNTPTVQSIVSVQENHAKYLLKDGLLTASEIDFLNVLKQVVGDSYVIHEQVPLSAIVKVRDSNENFTNYSDFNKIRAKSIDFVLSEKDSMKPYLCIELDDLSHMRWDRQMRDAFVNDVMKGVGLKILHVRTSRVYNIEWLKRQIFNNN